MTVCSDVLVPQLSVLLDELTHHQHTGQEAQVRHLYAMSLQEIPSPGEGHRLACHHFRDAELDRRPSAEIAWHQGGIEYRSADPDVEASIPKTVDLGVQNTVSLLDTPVAPDGDDLPSENQSCSDGYAALLQTYLRLVDGCAHELVH